MALRRSIAAASCGLAAAVMALLIAVLGAWTHPHYSHVSQFISELGASGAANAGLVAAAGFAPIGCLVLAFLALASKFFPRSRQATAGVICLGAVGAAYLVAAVFPCDAGCPSAGSVSQSVHNLFGFFEYLGALVGLLLLAAAFRQSPSWRQLAPVCVVSAFFVGAGFVGMLVPGLAAFRGLSQRVAEAAIFGWIGYISIVLLRAPRGDVVPSVPRSAGSEHSELRPYLLAIVIGVGFGLWELPYAAFMADDFIQLGILERVSPVTWIGPLELYTISDGDPQHVQLLKDSGALPWFLDPGFKMAFFRPLSSASLVLDHALFGLNPIGYRVHVGLWSLVLLVGAGTLYGRALGSLAPLALLLFALSGVHGIFCWTATRHIVIAAAIGVLMLYAHVRWRQESWRPGRTLSILGFVLALSASEAALGLVAYLFAYEIFGARGDRRGRVRATLPFVGIIAVYAALYRLLDLGTSGGSGYLDPLHDPLTYLIQIPGRVIFIIGAMIVGGNADLWVLRPDFRPAMILAAALITVIGAVLLWAASGDVVPNVPSSPDSELLGLRPRPYRWMVAGAVLSAIPFAGSPIGSRCVIVPWIGGAVAVAFVLRSWWTTLRQRPGFAYRLLGAACWGLAAIHLVLAPVQRLALPFLLRKTMSVELAQAVEDPSLGSDGLAGRTLVILNAPDFRIGLHAYFFRQLYRLPMPGAWRVLSWAPGAYRFHRSAADILEMEIVGGEIDAPFLAAGESVDIAGMRATITATGRTGPTQVTFAFDRSLDDPSVVLLGWKDGRLQTVAPPAIGETLDL